MGLISKHLPWSWTALTEVATQIKKSRMSSNIWGLFFLEIVFQQETWTARNSQLDKKRISAEENSGQRASSSKSHSKILSSQQKTCSYHRNDLASTNQLVLKPNMGFCKNLASNGNKNLFQWTP